MIVRRIYEKLFKYQNSSVHILYIFYVSFLLQVIVGGSRVFSSSLTNDNDTDFSLGTMVKTPSTISNIHSCSSIWIISIFESILSFNKRLTGLNDVE